MTITLGDYIKTLKYFPRDLRVRFDSDLDVPDKLISWRGSYDELSLDRKHDITDVYPTVADLLADAEAAVGKAFYGYKGGEFVMSTYTRVWADEWGECDGRYIAGFSVQDGMLVIGTAIDESIW